MINSDSCPSFATSMSPDLADLNSKSLIESGKPAYLDDGEGVMRRARTVSGEKAEGDVLVSPSRGGVDGRLWFFVEADMLRFWVMLFVKETKQCMQQIVIGKSGHLTLFANLIVNSMTAKEFWKLEGDTALLSVKFAPWVCIGLWCSCAPHFL